MRSSGLTSPPSSTARCVFGQGCCAARVDLVGCPAVCAGLCRHPPRPLATCGWVPPSPSPTPPPPPLPFPSPPPPPCRLGLPAASGHQRRCAANVPRTGYCHRKSHTGGGAGRAAPPTRLSGPAGRHYRAPVRAPPRRAHAALVAAALTCTRGDSLHTGMRTPVSRCGCVKCRRHCRAHPAATYLLTRAPRRLAPHPPPLAHEGSTSWRPRPLKM